MSPSFYRSILLAVSVFSAGQTFAASNSMTLNCTTRYKGQVVQDSVVLKASSTEPGLHGVMKNRLAEGNLGFAAGVSCSFQSEEPVSTCYEKIQRQGVSLSSTAQYMHVGPVLGIEGGKTSTTAHYQTTGNVFYNEGEDPNGVLFQIVCRQQ